MTSATSSALPTRPIGTSRSFSRIQAVRVAQGRFEATVPGVFVASPGLEYFVEVEGQGGLRRAHEGTAGEPRRLPVGRTVATSPPVYKRWWFWAAVGTAAVAGGAALYLMDDSDPDGGRSGKGLGVPLIAF